MKFSTPLLCIAVAFTAVAARAQSTTPVAAPPVTNLTTAAGQASNAEADKMVCHREPPGTGSRLASKPVCMTQREWDKARIEADKWLNKSQRMPHIQAPESH